MTPPTPSSTLEHLLGPAVAQFLAQCWPRGQRHLVVAGLEQRMPDLFSCAELTSLDALWDASPAHINAQTLDGEGKPQIADGLSPKDGKLLLRLGIGVQVLHLDQMLPVVDRLLSELSRELGFARSMFLATLFISPPGRGISKHFDDRDVWLIGLGGVKRVHVAPNRDVVAPDAVSLAVQRAPRVARYHVYEISPAMPEDSESVDITRGTCLFMPRGYWHETTSIGTSWSLSIGVRRPHWLELTLAALERKLIRDPRWREPVARLSSEAFDSETLRTLFADLGRRVDALGAEELLPPGPGELEPGSFVIDPAATIELSTGENPRAIVRRGDVEVELDMEPEYVAVVEHIRDCRSAITLDLLGARFPSLSQAELAGILRCLVESGLLRSA